MGQITREWDRRSTIDILETKYGPYVAITDWVDRWIAIREDFFYGVSK